MTDHVRTRQSIARTASLDEKNIFFYRPDPSKFRMPGSLDAPRELVEAQTELLKMGYQTIGAMKQLMRRREIRYWALCPNSEGNVYDEHVASMIRLVTWGKDMNPADPTISSAPKIPQEYVKLHIDPPNYFVYRMEYTRDVEAFITGPYITWLGAKTKTENLAEEMKGQFDHQAWRRWWETDFANAMWQWETCLEGLVLPCLEDVLDDVFLMIVDRVENGAELANRLYSSCPRNTSNDFAETN